MKKNEELVNIDNDLPNLNDDQLIEFLGALEGINDALDEIEGIEGGNTNE